MINRYLYNIVFYGGGKTRDNSEISNTKIQMKTK